MTRRVVTGERMTIARIGFLNIQLWDLLDIALVYEVIGAVGIDISLIWPPPGVTIQAAEMLSWTAVWIVIFPLLVPALLGSVKATTLVLEGDPMNQSTSWIGLLAASGAVCSTPSRMLPALTTALRQRSRFIVRCRITRPA